jgi:hypothetical protein
MTITTATASLAASGVVPKANHYTNVLAGTKTGVVSLSASALVWLAKIPPNCKNVQLIVNHNSGGAATAVIDYGIASEDGSVSKSALGSSIADVTTYISAPVNVTWDDAGGERAKYVTANRVSGTVTAVSLAINYQITYGF